MSPPTKDRLIRLGLWLTLGLLILGAYWQAPANSFHFDDYDNIVDHSSIREFTLTLNGLWSAASDGLLSRRVLPNLSFAIDWWRGGGEPGVFIWTNIALHVLTAIAVFGLINLSLRNRWPHAHTLVVLSVFVGTVAWAVHPIQTQAVGYIVQRMAVMAAMFSLLSVYCYIRARAEGTLVNRWSIAAILTFAAAALSKESAWIVPMLWWLAEFGVCRRGQPLLDTPAARLLFALPFALTLLVVADIVFRLTPVADLIHDSYHHRDFSISERALTQPRVVVFHLSQILWPLADRFSVEHPFPLSTGLTTPGVTLAALLGVIGWIGAGLYALFYPHWRLVGFWMLWLPLTLAIESSVYGLEVIFEHRMYLPSVGIAALLAMGITAANQARRSRVLSLLLALLLVVVLGWNTRERLRDWHDGISLYTSATQHAPASGRAWLGLGAAQLNAEQAQAAERSLQRAVRLDDSLWAAHEKLGVINLDRGAVNTARVHLQQAYRHGGGRHSILNHLGEVNFATGEMYDAVQRFSRAVAKAGWEPLYRWNLALALERVQRCDEALTHWRTFQRLSTDAADLGQVSAHLQQNYGDGGGVCAGTQH